MKILFVLEHYHPYIGGVEKLFKELCQSLAADGHTVRVVTTRFHKDLPLRETLKGVEIVRLPVSNRYIFTFFGFFLGWRFSKGFDIIHTTSYNAALPASLMGLFRRRRAIITFHEVWSRLWFELPMLSWPERILFYCYEQFVLRLPFTMFVAVSDFTRKSLLAYRSPQRVVRIYNGLEYREQYRPAVPAGSGFLYFGRLGVSKGLDVILGACELLADQQTAFTLTIVIPQVPRAMYHKVIAQIEGSRYRGSIVLKHHLSDEELQMEIERAGCVIIPSYSEGFCFAAAEVSAMRKPIIHSGRGALPEVVSGAHIQLPELTSEALALAMHEALAGKWQTAPLRTFPLSATVAEYTSLYSHLAR